MLLMHLNGEGNVFSVKAVRHEDVTEATKALSPQELQVKSLADKAKYFKQQEKVLRSRQKNCKSSTKISEASKALTTFNIYDLNTR
jgi:hypothetical protein